MLAFLFFAAAIAAIPYQANANNMREVRGLAAMHAIGVENGRLCMNNHYGETDGWPTEKEAKAHAVISWVGFTRLEYGNHWANFRVAAARKFSCKSKATPRGTTWSCAVEAWPCSN